MPRWDCWAGMNLISFNEIRWWYWDVTPKQKKIVIITGWTQVCDTQRVRSKLSDIQQTHNIKVKDWSRQISQKTCIFFSQLIWEDVGISPEVWAQVAVEREVWIFVFKLLPPQPIPDKQKTMAIWTQIIQTNWSYLSPYSSFYSLMNGVT